MQVRQRISAMSMDATCVSVRRRIRNIFVTLFLASIPLANWGCDGGRPKATDEAEKPDDFYALKDNQAPEIVEAAQLNSVLRGDRWLSPDADFSAIRDEVAAADGDASGISSNLSSMIDLIEEISPGQRKQIAERIRETAANYALSTIIEQWLRENPEETDSPLNQRTHLSSWKAGMESLRENTPQALARQEAEREREAERRREMAEREEQRQQALASDPALARDGSTSTDLPTTEGLFDRPSEELRQEELRRDERRQATTGSGDGSGCADGRICTQTVKNAEDAMARISAVVESGTLDITNSNLAMALLARGNIACIRVCLEMEETRSECRQGLEGAIRELQMTYDSSLTSARQASLDDAYVDSFDRDPQGSEFMRRYFGDASGFGHIDTCGATSW